MRYHFFKLTIFLGFMLLPPAIRPCVAGMRPSAHRPTGTPAHRPTPTSPHPHILTSPHPHILTSPHPHILTSPHPHILTSTHPHIHTSSRDLSSYVNPFVGTMNMGHTFPGATVPFGMVQLSPETRQVPYEKDRKYNPETYRYCSGYQYEDTTIFGFSHTHFSGTGHSDLGDFLIMPTTGPLNLEPGDASRPGSGYFSNFRKDNETATPGYYSVYLEDYVIKAELTTTGRVGFHQYTAGKTGDMHIILDMISNIYNYDDKNVWTFIRVENDTLVTGYRQTSGWARTRVLYFAMVFSKPLAHYGHKKYDDVVYRGFYRKFDETKDFPEMAGRRIRAWFDFTMGKGEKLQIKFALSGVSAEGALKNMNAEAPHWDFDRVCREGRDIWNNELEKVRVDVTKPEDMVTFYTALYHTMLSPVVFMDVDGAYRGLDQNIHHAEGFTHYTIFSLWDTYRALHPLFNILQPSRNADMINSMLAHYDQSVHHILPIWSHYANENWCMIGYHAVSVIADAVVKNISGFDRQKALQACVRSASYGLYDGLDQYMRLGYVPEDKSSSSVSKTLEYAYDDWCIAQLAEKLEKAVVRDSFFMRSQRFKKVFDPSTGFMRPRLSDGQWKQDFNTLSTHGQGFIEGNAWNYSLYVPHDPQSLIRQAGGAKKFTTRLDSLFSMQLGDEHFRETEDITRDGIIGNYVHGNEPGHHIPYLYNFVGKPRKTQERVRMIMDSMYGPGPDGLCGNDDAGQMSAWYVFSALGFYPVCPGSDRYELGSPLVKSAKITLENGNKLNIETMNQVAGNFCVKKTELNGKILDRNYITHKELTTGSRIIFFMSKR